MAKKLKSLCGQSIIIGNETIMCNDQIPGHAAGRYHSHRDDERGLFMTWTDPTALDVMSTIPAGGARLKTRPVNGRRAEIVDVGDALADVTDALEDE